MRSSSRNKLIIGLMLVGWGASVGAFNRSVWLDSARQHRAEAVKMAKSYGKFAKLVTTPAEKVTLPIDTFPDGKVKSSIYAEKAYMFIVEGMIWGESVLAREFDHDGNVVASFKAKNILVDRKRKLGWVPSRCEVEYSGTIVAGRGNYVNFAEKFISIGTEARVVSKNLKLHDAMAAVSPEGEKKREAAVRVASIDAKRADYDNLEGVILFDGKVLAKCDGYEMHAERLWVFFTGTNQLSRVVAEGSVAMTNGTKSAICDQAVYNRSESKLTMFGSGSAPARLTESGEKKGEIEGSKIVYWTDSEQIEIMNTTITIDAEAFRGRELKSVIKAERE